MILSYDSHVLCGRKNGDFGKPPAVAMQIDSNSWQVPRHSVPQRTRAKLDGSDENHARKKKFGILALAFNGAGMT